LTVGYGLLMVNYVFLMMNYGLITTDDEFFHGLNF